MTAWQDQPPQEQQPQSRRQLRLNAQRAELQRADLQDSGASDTGAADGAARDQAGQSQQQGGQSRDASSGSAPAYSQAETARDARHGLRTQGIVDTQDGPLAMPEAQPPQFDTFAHPAWEAPARRSAPDEAPGAQPRSRAEAAFASGRRAQHGMPQAAPEAPSPEPEAGSEAQGHVSTPAQPQTAPEAPAPEDRPVYRIRDFRPEARRSAFSSTSELSPSDWGRPGASGEPGTLDYYTQQRPGQQPADAVQGEVDTEDRAHTDDATRERPAALITPPPAAPLTRRELRALRQSAAPDAESDAPQTETNTDATQHEAPQAEAPQPPSDEQSQRTPPPLRAPETPAPQSSHELSNALAEFDALMGGTSSEEPSAQAASLQPDSQSDLIQPVRASAATSAEATGLEAPSTESSEAPKGQGVAAEDSAAQATSVDGPAVEASSPTTAAPHAASEAVDADAAASRPYSVPTGHWSTQAAVDDETDGVTLSRNIGVTSASVTSNHLVISSVPNAKDLLLPFTPTGEIMVTGTIDLPRSFGTTGAHPARYDHSDVDALLEASDREDSDVDSAPVRAIRAVSTHTSSRGLIGNGKPPRNSRLPMVLAVSTAALATVVVVLFVAGFVLHLF